MSDNKPTVAAVICEFNLLHRGHVRLAESVRARLGEDTVVAAIMSGSFVQRGIPASADKRVRAELAVKCGYDIVIELPYPWCCAPAENFALAGVTLASAVGADYLSFGSESDESAVSTAAQRLASPEFAAVLDSERQMHSGESEIRLRERAYTALYGDGFPVKPNDILGVEYLRALDRVQNGIPDAPKPLSQPKPLIVRRNGGESATRSREIFEQAFAESRSGGFDRERFITENEWLFPKPTAEYIADSIQSGRAPRTLHSDRSDGLFVGFYRFADRAQIDRCAGMGGGISGRLIKSAQNPACRTVRDLLDLAATKKYTSARLRRAMIHGVIGAADEDIRSLPLFSFILAANDRGRSALRRISDALGDIEDGSALTLCSKPTVPTRAPKGTPLRRQGELAAEAEALAAALENVQ